MTAFQRAGSRPTASASFLWEDAESGDRLHVSIQVDEQGHQDFFEDLERTGFRRLGSDGSQESRAASRSREMPTTHARRSGQAGTKDGDDGGTLPCSIDISSAFHATSNESSLAASTAAGEHPGPKRRESA